MTTIGKDFPVRAHAFLLSSEKRASSAARSPADTLCLDIFSPPPGDSDVTSQVDRLSSNEMNIAQRSAAIVVGASSNQSSRSNRADIGRMSWINWTNLGGGKSSRPLAIYPHPL